ncbi:MAG: hypothetical protein HKN24_03865 [Acidimicrobiales bacterium]|nr:hypothetical protein [Acidimicrobiales bacterium]
MWTSRRRVILGSVAGLALVASSCAASTTQAGDAQSDDATSSTSAAAESADPTPSTTSEPTATSDGVTTTATPETPAANNFPDLTVTDVSSGQEISLRTLGESGTPVAMWFYYPH